MGGRLTFRLKVFVLAAAAMVLLAAALTVVQDRMVGEALSRQLDARASSVRPILAAALTAALAERDFATIQAVVAEAVSGGSFAHMLLLDPSGQALSAAGWDMARLGRPPNEAARFEMPDGDTRLLDSVRLDVAG